MRTSYLFSSHAGDVPVSPLNECIMDPLEPILFFLLNMTVRMRIDRFEGMGDPVWAWASILPAVLSGFFEGLRQKEDEGKISSHIREKMLLYLRDIPRKTLREKLVRQIEIYRGIDPVDFS
ncbi:MAG: hypothetical protein JW896_16565 [Deltaproteobacteria bacterium]|nr:hypothetical protein [Deltaproteobacteria bacterium]